jgi:CTP:molybdopterin cytidylyltransferase MocA
MQPIPAILLAAGLSSRMQAFKPLLPLRGKPLIVHAIQCLQNSAAIDPILVVTGHRSHNLLPVLARFPVTPILNPNYASGEMLSSLLAGIAALPLPPAFLLAFADQPAISPDTIRALVQAWHNSASPLVIPTFLGKRGHPLVISSSLIPDIRALPSHDSLRSVVHQHLDRASLLAVDDPTILEDLDTPEDFHLAETAHGAPSSSAGSPSNGDSHG